MPDARALIDRLPSLYRPEPDDGSLLATFLNAVAAELGRARDEASMVLPAHWSQHADRAVLDAWFARQRSAAGLPALVPTDLIDFADPVAALIAIKDANTPLTQHLRAGLSAPLRTELDAWDDTEQGPPKPLQRRVLDALNRRVRGEALYNADRFTGITLLPETIARAESNPVGAERTVVNVQLLIEAFPDELRRAVLDLPWVRDLGRLGAVVPLVPWREPSTLRESAEAYRVRLRRMVALYRNGLGTVGALRSVVEATLPIDVAQPPELRDAPFEIEEFAPLQNQVTQAPTNGPPDELVGPLMRWQLENSGLHDVAPTLFITGLETGPGISETVDPMVELYAVGAERPRIGIGYDGTLAADQTLRLRPAHSTWTTGAAGLLRAEHLPADDSIADPSSPGVSAAVAGAPANIVAIAHTPDGMFWAAGDNGTRLARFDGNAWSDVATGLPAVRCLVAGADELLIGTANGLSRTPLFPEDDDFTPEPIAGFGSVAIRAIGSARVDGTRFIGTDTGALSWNGVTAPVPLPLGGGTGVATAVRAVHHDASGSVHFAGDLGVFEHQPATDAWFWYSGQHFTEQSPEWRAFAAGSSDTPADERVFLPPVFAVHRGPDASLWFGTAAGIARYVARSQGGSTYTTLLEAYPDLTTGSVRQIHQDERGGVWFCTDRGLLRYDGRDFYQRRAGAWVHLGRSDLLPGIVAQERGAWRFDRASGQWQRFDTRGAGFVVPAIQLRTTAEPAVIAVVVSDAVVADIGAIEEEEFAAASAVAASDLFLHIQPTEDRIVNGGIPYIPRLPVGESTWRYLSREPVDLVPAAAEHRPAWSMEGRLFPPPPDLDAPYAGRWDVTPPFDGHFDQAVFSYDPAARVAFAFGPTQPCSVLVRLRRRAGQASIDPAVIDRVWEGMQLVRPAGVRTTLAVDDTIVKGS
jgi:hypothetical protein